MTPLPNRYTFRLLKSDTAPHRGGDVIEQCGALLENRMRCTRASEYLVKDEQNPDKPYQVCKRHAIILETEGLKSEEVVEKEVPLDTPPSELAPQTTIPPVDKEPITTSGKQGTPEEESVTTLPTKTELVQDQQKAPEAQQAQSEKPKTVADVLNKK